MSLRRSLQRAGAPIALLVALGALLVAFSFALLLAVKWLRFASTPSFSFATSTSA
jgi:hypothetical protein